MIALTDNNFATMAYALKVEHHLSYSASNTLLPVEKARGMINFLSVCVDVVKNDPRQSWFTQLGFLAK